MVGERFARVPDNRLTDIFDRLALNRKIVRPNSLQKHDWTSEDVLVAKDEWERDVLPLIPPELAGFYGKYTNRREYKEWLNTEINRIVPDDRTKSALVQLYGLKRASPVGLIVHEGLLSSHSALPLETLPDGGISAYIQDWTISRQKDPSGYLRLVRAKLSENGIYVFTDRKPFEEIKDVEFDPDGVVRILERRVILDEDGSSLQYIIPKYFFRDLPKTLQQIGLQTLYSSKQDNTCIYEIVMAVKSRDTIQSISIEKMQSSEWENLMALRRRLKEKFT